MGQWVCEGCLKNPKKGISPWKFGVNRDAPPKMPDKCPRCQMKPIPYVWVEERIQKQEGIIKEKQIPLDLRKKILASQFRKEKDGLDLKIWDVITSFKQHGHDTYKDARDRFLLFCLLYDTSEKVAVEQIQTWDKNFGIQILEPHRKLKDYEDHPRMRTFFLRSGLSMVRNACSTIKKKTQRKEYIRWVFDHDKGYPRALMYAQNIPPPEGQTMREALTDWLDNVYTTPNCNIFTYKWGDQRIYRDQIIEDYGKYEKGSEEYYNMWAAVLQVIAKCMKFGQSKEKVMKYIKETNFNEFQNVMRGVMIKLEVIGFVTGYLDTACTKANLK
jgi:hypothetical protein